MPRSFLQRTMKPGDWLKLIIIVIWFIFCWGLVWYQYSQPLNYDVMMQKALTDGQK